jgi:hypothetical protein
VTSVGSAMSVHCLLCVCMPSTLTNEAFRVWEADLQLGGEALLVALAEEDNDVIDGIIGGLADLIGRLAETDGD